MDDLELRALIILMAEVSPHKSDALSNMKLSSPNDQGGMSVNEAHLPLTKVGNSNGRDDYSILFKKK